MCVLPGIVAAVVVTLHPRSGDVVPVSFTSLAFNGIITIWGNWHVAADSCLHSTARRRHLLASAAHRVLSITKAVNLIICAGVPWSGAAVGGTVPCQGDVTAAAGAPLVCAEVATFVLPGLTFPVLAGDMAEAGPQHEEQHGTQGVHGECGYLVAPPITRGTESYTDNAGG